MLWMPLGGSGHHEAPQTETPPPLLPADPERAAASARWTEKKRITQQGPEESKQILTGREQLLEAAA